jgi:hypothetical protein
MLTDSLALDAGPTDLGRAVAEVKADRRRRAGDTARRLGLGWLHDFDRPKDDPIDAVEGFEADVTSLR